jgi:hypothetical protein
MQQLLAKEHGQQNTDASMQAGNHAAGGQTGLFGRLIGTKGSLIKRFLLGSSRLHTKSHAYRVTPCTSECSGRTIHNQAWPKAERISKGDTPCVAGCIPSDGIVLTALLAGRVPSLPRSLHGCV